MRRKLLEKVEKVKSHPATKESLRQIKPKKTFWSLLGVALFFILPEIVAFIWGADIKAWTQSYLSQPLSLDQEYKYKAIEMLFTEPSYLNLILGIVLFVWAFF
jgi:hypothetical protein